MVLYYGLSGWQGNVSQPARALGLRPGPASVWHRPHSLPQGDESIDWEMLKRFQQPIGPVHLEVDRSETPEAEVYSGIVAGIETALA
jgi:hypothetical protein